MPGSYLLIYHSHIFLVKTNSGNILTAMSHATVTPIHDKPQSLADRIRWILETRELTQEQYSDRCGFSQPTHVGSIMYRLRNDPGYADKMQLDTYQKLAHGGRVSLYWLMFGDGNPDAKQLTRVRYRNLVSMLMSSDANRGRWDVHTVEAANKLQFNRDPSESEWIDILDKVEGSLVTVRKQFALREDHE